MANNILLLILKETRPRQWIKNLVVFTVVVFSNQLLNIHSLIVTTEILGILILLTSGIYIINDIVDRKEDQLHSEKKFRPIASGQLSVRIALIAAVLFLFAGGFAAYKLSEYLFGIYLAYIILMVAYSFFLKNITIVDAITIAIGFVMRVIAGAIVVNVPLSSYLIILVISTAILISIGKRRGEITQMSNEKAIAHRKVLKEYPVQLLDTLISALFATTFFAYILYTFQKELGPTNSIIVVYLPQHFQNPHWLKLTIPLVFYCLARYTYLIYSKGGTLEKMLFQDKPLLISVILWILSVGAILYTPIF